MKKISKVDDLALFGADPAFDHVVHVGRPNIGSMELFDSLVQGMFDRRWLSNQGPLVEQFEAELCMLLGVKHCVAVCNGTVGLEVAIRALELSGEVIVPSYTFIATPHALTWLGLKPVFVDINPETHNLDPRAVECALSSKTSAIIGTHLWGRACDVDALERIANEARVELMFDAAHAFMCSANGQMIGNFGRAEVFSFHATKFFNSFEGGAIATNDDELATKLKAMRNFGFAGFDNVTELGTNGKMSEVCAAMGLANLRSTAQFVAQNKANYQLYMSALAGIEGISILPLGEGNATNYQYVVMEVSAEFGVARDKLLDALQAENILARKYFWPGCHRMPIYRSLLREELSLPQTERVSERVIVLPTGTTLPKGTVEIVADIVRVMNAAAMDG